MSKRCVWISAPAIAGNQDNVISCVLLVEGMAFSTFPHQSQRHQPIISIFVVTVCRRGQIALPVEGAMWLASSMYLRGSRCWASPFLMDSCSMIQALMSPEFLLICVFALQISGHRFKIKASLYIHHNVILFLLQFSKQTFIHVCHNKLCNLYNITDSVRSIYHNSRQSH